MIILNEHQKSTPAACIPQWHSELRKSIIQSINNKIVTTTKGIEETITEITDDSTIQIQLFPLFKLPSHPQDDTPIMHFDQLLTVAHHHNTTCSTQKKDGTSTKLWMDTLNPPPITNDITMTAMMDGNLKPKLTRKYLKQQLDWDVWNQSEFHQLNMYHAQEMFVKPEPAPHTGNVLPLIWSYVIKLDGTRKARCVINGSPCLKGSITLGQTYAAALKQSGARLFWALSAINNYVVTGADASNAFTEAAPPTASLYVQIDDVFREWWMQV